MKRLALTSILVNLAGLMIVQLLETWRPGVVSGVVSLGWVWLGAALLVVATLTTSRSRPNQSPATTPNDDQGQVPMS